MKDSNNSIAGVDLSSVDPKTVLIRDRVISRWGAFWAQPDKVLTAQQVAEAIKEAILSENPNFRYQTNEHYCPDEIEAKKMLFFFSCFSHERTQRVFTGSTAPFSVIRFVGTYKSHLIFHAPQKY